MAIAQRVKQQLGPTRVVLQGVQELQPVVVRDHAVGRGRDAPQQLEYPAAPAVIARLGQVGGAVGREGDDLGARIAAVAHLIQHALQQVVARHADDQVERGNGRQVQQRLRRRDVQILEQLLHPQVQVQVVLARLGALTAHHIVQAQCGGQRRGVNSQPLGQAPRQQAFQRLTLVALAHQKRAGIDHRNDLALGHVGQQVVQLVQCAPRHRE